MAAPSSWKAWRSVSVAWARMGTEVPAKLEELLAGIGAAIDAVGGSFTMRYTTVAVTAARTGAASPAFTLSAPGGDAETVRRHGDFVSTRARSSSRSLICVAIPATTARSSPFRASCGPRVRGCISNPMRSSIPPGRVRYSAREALFTLGDRPELRWDEARQWLDERGYESALDYVRAMAIRVRSRWLSRLSTRSIAAQADMLA